jgi:MFS family permease
MSNAVGEMLHAAGSRETASRAALAALSLAMLLSSLGTSIANVALPNLALAFEASFQKVQWVVLAYLLSITTLTVVAGRMGDLVGRRRLLVGGIALFGAASGAAALAPSLDLLIVARAAQGVGAAVMMALSLALVTEVVPKEKSGTAMGLLGTTSAAGTALGPSLGGVLLAMSGWRALFSLLAVLGAAAFLLATIALPREEPRESRVSGRFDTAGTFLLASTLAAYVLGATLGRGSFGPLNGALLAGAAIGAVLFTLVERRVESPLIRLSLLRRPILASGLAMSTIVSTIVMAILVVGPFYLSRALGLDAAMTGLALSVGPLVAAITGAPAGRLVDRLGPSRVALAGLLAIACGSVALAMLPPSGVAAFIVPVAVITAGYALFQTANNTSVMRDGGSERGVISGLLNLSRNIGLLTGASVMGVVFAHAARSRDVSLPAPDAIAFGFRCTFAIAFVLTAVAIGIALRSARLQRSVA